MRAGWERLPSALRAALVDERHGPLPALLVGLTALAGVVDAVSILALDRVFVAAMTGNLVFIGLGISGAHGFGIRAPAIALAAFVAGVVIGNAVCRSAADHRGLALRNITALKGLLALVVTVAAVGSGDRFTPPERTWVTVLLAASMGAQLALIRYLKVPDLMTTVMTLTIIGVITEHGPARREPAMIRRGLALVAFAVGAICGGLLVRLVSVGAALGLGLAIIVAVGVETHLVSRRGGTWAAPL